MAYRALSVVAHLIRVGVPLPFDVHDAERTLLLARGQRVDSSEQLEALFARGALVAEGDLAPASSPLEQLPRHELPQHWSRCLGRISQALQHAPPGEFGCALEEASTPVLALIERDPDLAIFQVLRGEGDATAYGVRRSLNTAITAYLVAQRLAWDDGAMHRVFKVALTMNVSMLALQGDLARQTHLPSEAQREALRLHPLHSRQMLERAGIGDADWLQAVLRHHEMEDGSGYPTGCSDVGELASLARRADLYTAKLASRSRREALAADVAGRQMFMQDPGHPMTAALVKEFGIYPPGCCVRLASGATAIVVERGPSVTTPIVACLTRPDGLPLALPLRRETAEKQHAVVGIVGERSVNMRVSAEKLFAAAFR